MHGLCVELSSSLFVCFHISLRSGQRFEKVADLRVNIYYFFKPHCYLKPIWNIGGIQEIAEIQKVKLVSLCSEQKSTMDLFICQVAVCIQVVNL